MKLREAVQQQLREAHLSQRSIALRAGIEPGLFNAYIHGKRPNRRNAERVAAALRIDARELFEDFDQLRPY